MPHYDRDGRLRILFTDAYETLARRGVLTAEQAEAVQELVDRLEEWTPEELEGRLAALFPDRGQKPAETSKAVTEGEG